MSDFNGALAGGPGGLSPNGGTSQQQQQPDNPNGQPPQQPPTSPNGGQVQNAPSSNWQDDPEYKRIQAERDREMAAREAEFNRQIAATQAENNRLRQMAEQNRDLVIQNLPDEEKQSFMESDYQRRVAELNQREQELQFQQQFAPVQAKAAAVLGDAAYQLDWSNPMQAYEQSLDLMNQQMQGFNQFAAPPPQPPPPQQYQQASPYQQQPQQYQQAPPVHGQAAQPNGYPSLPQSGYPNGYAAGSAPNNQQQALGHVRDAMAQIGANAVDIGGGSPAQYNDETAWQQEMERLEAAGDMQAAIVHRAMHPKYTQG